MRQIFSTATQDASIVIIQGAYESFCGPATTQTVYDRQQFSVILATPEAIAPAAQADRLKFQQLVTDWRQQRGAKPSMAQAAMCSAYQNIVGMGQTAVPLLLRQLQSEGATPDHWFWALKAITGVDPVPDNERGDLMRMAQRWLEWGDQQGYAW
jgi:hypothetical protein